jgi:histidinol phosphatase-like enzyme
LLSTAADDFNVDLSRSIFIGDSDTDIQAAQAAGCEPVLLGSSLCEGSDSWEWATNFPIARTTEELFSVVSKCLQGQQAATSRNARAGEHA